MQPPIGLVIESQFANLGIDPNSIQTSDGFSMFGGTSSSENVISIPGFDQLLQNVIGPTKIKKRSFTKKRR